MNKKSFKKYLSDFEKKVIINGFETGVFEETKKIIPLKAGKLAKTALGSFIGLKFDYSALLTIDYYGLYKLSSEIYRAVDSVKLIFPELKSIKSPCVHFNSIKGEMVTRLAPELMKDFESFKKYIVELRWGNQTTK